MPAGGNTVRIATRGSELALWQADYIGARLRALDPELTVEVVVVSTHADRRQDIPIWAMGGKGMFVKEVQAVVLDGDADLAVHSGKDLPSVTHDDLVLAAVPERGECRDALVGATLDGLRPGARVATGSARRRVQLADARPDLTFAELRGNMRTRLAALGRDGIDAIVVAAVAFQRLGLDEHLTEVLDQGVVLPQVAQGALAVECRTTDDSLRRRLAAIEHGPSRRAVDAERAFLAELGGDCDLPAGAHAVPTGDDVVLDALLASPDGHVVLRHRQRGPSAVEVGRSAARHLLDRAGGAALLEREPAV
jgi:hydroxymethylbilane synthase